MGYGSRFWLNIGVDGIRDGAAVKEEQNNHRAAVLEAVSVCLVVVLYLTDQMGYFTMKNAVTHQARTT